MCEMWIIKQLDLSVFVTPVKNFEMSTFIESNICKNPEVKNVSSTQGNWTCVHSRMQYIWPLQKKIGCFNHRVVTPVAVKLWL